MNKFYAWKMSMTIDLQNTHTHTHTHAHSTHTHTHTHHTHTHTHLIGVFEDEQFLGRVTRLLEAGVNDGSENSPRVAHVQRGLLS